MYAHPNTSPILTNTNGGENKCDHIITQIPVKYSNIFNTHARTATHIDSSTLNHMRAHTQTHIHTQCHINAD